MEIVDYIVAEDKDLVKMALVGDQVAFEYLFNRKHLLNLFFVVEDYFIVLCKVVCGAEWDFVEQLNERVAGKALFAKLHNAFKVAVLQARAVAYYETSAALAVFE